MSSVLSLINRLLPFATPGTPLLQDLVHLAAICLLLYFAPQLQDWARSRQHPTINDTATGTNGETPDTQTTDAPVEPREAAVDESAEVLHPDEAAVELPAPQVNGHAQPEAEEQTDDENDPPEGSGAANASANRDIGAKKARSLARKDQRRAYNEFMRSQGDAQRARDAEGAAEREAALEAERTRRALAEAELAAKKAKEREQKREAEQAEREAEYQRRESAIAIVKTDLLARSMSDLHRVAEQVGGDVDEEWVEKVLNASGIVGRKSDVLTMITSTGWAASITRSDARALYDQAAAADISDELGYVDTSKMSAMLVTLLSDRAVSADA